jgi:serine protease inhibitor
VHGGEVALSELPRAAGAEVDLPGVVPAVQSFAADLYGRLAARPGNLVYSPLSVAVALTMALAGARGDTAIEMRAVLHATGSDAFDRGMNALLGQLEVRTGPRQRRDGSTDEVVLDAANSLWGQRDLRWHQAFLDALARYYGAGMRLVDYKQDADGAAALINAWTSQQTRGKIPQIIPPGVLDVMTRLVLVNAIYLKAAWEEPFDRPTTRRAFTTGDGSRLDVLMMAQDLHRAAYCSGPGWRAARLSYVGAEIAMAVLVPDPGVSLSSVEASLDGTGLQRLLTSFRPVPAIRVEMPRWKFRVQEQLNDHLDALGMPTAFNGSEADFSGMTAQEQLGISHVLHEAFIAVDEEGTEAAAATAVAMVETSARIPVSTPLTLVADRPFLFVVFDKATATPLFIGRVHNPTQ